jgi:hypothetical protein
VHPVQVQFDRLSVVVDAWSRHAESYGGPRSKPMAIRVRADFQ